MKLIDISLTDSLVILGYLMLLVFAGIYISRKNSTQNTSSSEDLFLSGRSLPWYKVGLSIFSTNVSPSMLVAYFGAAYTSGLVLANFEWMAWIFLMLLSFFFIPHYLKNRISTMPEFLMKRFGTRSHTFFTYFSMFSSLIIWSSFMLCIGGLVIHQLTDIPVYISTVCIVIIALSYSVNGGLNSIVHTGVIQSIVLLCISMILFFRGLDKIGGVDQLVQSVPRNFWSIFRASDDPAYPWHAIILGYPVIGIWFWCTEQSIVQRTLAAKSIEQGQIGAWLVAVLKMIMPFIFIVPGIMCLVLVKKGVLPVLESPDHAYITMVYGLLPKGLIGLALATLVVSIINDVATGISSFSTVFALDLYGKKINPGAHPNEVSKIGKRMAIVAGVISVMVALFFANSDKGLFELGQSLGTYLAPPVATVFILGLLWKKATPKAAEWTLYIGTITCLIIGLCQLLNFPDKNVWPHFMLLCFYMMTGLLLFMVIFSLFTQGERTDKNNVLEYSNDDIYVKSESSVLVKLLWILVAFAMMTIYYIFR